MNLCRFKQLGAPGECDFGPTGRADPCHLIPQQRIKIALGNRGIAKHYWPAILWDSRLYVLGCRKHHNLFDSGHWKLMRAEQYPDMLLEWADEYGFYWNGSRDGWRAEHKPQPPREAA